MTPSGATPQIQPDGTVTAGGAAVGRIATWHLAGPVDRLAPSLVAPAPGGRAEPVAAPLRSGELETGNVAPLEGMVQLISAQRSFDASMQALQIYRGMDARGTDLGRVR